MATVQPAYSIQETTASENTTQGAIGGLSPDNENQWRSLLPDEEDRANILARLDATLTASLTGSMAGLALAAAALLLTRASSLEEEIDKDQRKLRDTEAELVKLGHQAEHIEKMIGVDRAAHQALRTRFTAVCISSEPARE